MTAETLFGIPIRSSDKGSAVFCTLIESRTSLEGVALVGGY